MNEDLGVRNAEEIAEVEDQAMEAIETGESHYPGMSYEEGIRATFEWLRRDDADPPFDGE